MGNTSAKILSCARFQKHPHTRGEYWRKSLILKIHIETPPHAWGILTASGISFLRSRNTPTRVGNTTGDAFADVVGEKHPPHAWGIPAYSQCSSPVQRNTPTRVGNTLSFPLARQSSWKHPPHAWGILQIRSCHKGQNRKHPHTRGEYLDDMHYEIGQAETPPHAWGIHDMDIYYLSWCRNTPTRVGNTRYRARQRIRSKKHPHTRGEYHTAL